MKKVALKLMLSLAAMPVSLFCVGLTKNEWFFAVFLLSIPFAILYWIDLGQTLRNSQSRSWWLRALGIIMGVPQALFGLVCAASGLAIIAWVVYNTFVERLPEYSGSFFTFGVGPALALFGFGWLINAFRRSDGSDEA